MHRFIIVVLCSLSCQLAPDIAVAQFDDGARYAFTPSAEQLAIYVLDLQEKRIGGRILLDEVPDSVSPSDSLNALVVGHREAMQLSLIDLSDKAMPRHNYPLGLSPDFVAVSPPGDNVAVYDEEKNILQIHAIHRRAILLHADDIVSTQSFTFNADGSSIFWVNEGDGSVNVIDLWSEKKTLQLARPDSRLSALTRSTDGLLGFVSNADQGSIYVINLHNFTLLTTLRAGRGPGRPWGTADGQYMFVPNRDDNSVSAISTSNLQVIFTVDVGARPVSIHSGWLDTVAAVVNSDGSIALIDVSGRKLSRRFELGEVALDGIVTSDSKTLALPVPALGEFAFLDMRSQSLLEPVRELPTDIGAASIAISNNLCH
jgi:YVTN family beta-propeller protein